MSLKVQNVDLIDFVATIDLDSKNLDQNFD